MAILTKLGGNSKVGIDNKTPTAPAENSQQADAIPTNPPYVQSDFNSKDSRWKCLCGCLDVKTGEI